MRYDVTDEDDAYVLLGIRQGVLACSEEIQYRVYENEGDCHEQQADDDVQCDYIAKNLVGCLVVLLSEKDGKHCCCTGSYEGAECCGKVHERECDSKT